MTTHLIIPDAHAHPDFHNRRFDWLGRAIADIKPDVVVGIGDWADMPSLSHYDKGTKGFEGRRYQRDVAASQDAFERMFKPIRAAKRKLPRFVFLEGNHEHRIERAISNDAAQLDGIIGLNDLGFVDYPIDFVPYRGGTPGVISVDGINYAHFFTSGIMGRPIGGMHPAFQLVSKQYSSCTQGHSHTTDYSVRTDAQGRFIHGLVCGVFQDYEADFAGVANDMWWKGIVVKRNVDNGQYDPQWISMNALQREYR